MPKQFLNRIPKTKIMCHITILYLNRLGKDNYAFCPKQLLNVETLNKLTSRVS